MCTCVCQWRSEDNLWESVVSSHGFQGQNLALEGAGQALSPADLLPRFYQRLLKADLRVDRVEGKLPQAVEKASREGVQVCTLEA